MTEQELLKDILTTKLELEDIITAHKLEQDPIQKNNLKIEYCKMLNKYCAKQNNYRNEIRRLYKNE